MTQIIDMLNVNTHRDMYAVGAAFAGQSLANAELTVMQINGGV